MPLKKLPNLYPINDRYLALSLFVFLENKEPKDLTKFVKRFGLVLLDMISDACT